MHYPGQQVVMLPAVVTAVQLNGHAVVVDGKQFLSSIRVPLEHSTPTLTPASVPIHVVEQDPGGVNGTSAVVMLAGLIEDGFLIVKEALKQK
jgi:hypothetical protein